MEPGLKPLTENLRGKTNSLTNSKTANLANKPFTDGKHLDRSDKPATTKTHPASRHRSTNKPYRYQGMKQR